MRKVLCLMLVSLMVLGGSSALATEGSTNETLMMSAKVEGKVPVAIKAVASGHLLPFDYKVGQKFNKGDLLFAMQSETVYSDVAGTINRAYVGEGDSLQGANARYGAIMHIEYENNMVINASTRDAYDDDADEDIYVGMPVYIRATHDKLYADGFITNKEGSRFTVEVIGDEIKVGENARIYSTSDYANKSLLGYDELERIAPYALSNINGTVVEMCVSAGDSVQVGDPLFRYVPDSLPKSWVMDTASLSQCLEQNIVISSIDVAQGASVQKDQVLATAYAVDDVQLVAHVEERDLNSIKVGDVFTVQWEEQNSPAIEATVSALGYVGDNSGEHAKYPVYLDFPATEGICIGMEASLEK